MLKIFTLYPNQLEEKYAEFGKLHNILHSHFLPKADMVRMILEYEITQSQAKQIKKNKKAEEAEELEAKIKEQRKRYENA